jgi:hypothetical protein
VTSWPDAFVIVATIAIICTTVIILSYLLRIEGDRDE